MPVLGVVSSGRDGGWKGGGLLLVDGLHELADHEGHALDALDLLLGADELPLEVPLLILDVLLLELEVSAWSQQLPRGCLDGRRLL